MKSELAKARVDRKRPLRDQIYELIRNLVLTGKIGPGEIRGEMAYLEAGEASAPVIAEQEVEAVAIQWSVLDNLFGLIPIWRRDFIARWPLLYPDGSDECAGSFLSPSKAAFSLCKTAFIRRKTIWTMLTLR